MLRKANLKVVTIFGTRPEIIRLSRILPLLDQYVEHYTVFTKQSFDYEMSEIFFRELKLRTPDQILEVRSQTLGGQIANILVQSEKVLLREIPDALLVLGDTNSSLCTIIAKRLKIPIFHLEAGNRAFDWDVPEEVNRRIVDHISDYNLAYTEHARRYLIAEGIHPSTVFVTGSPYPEIFKYYARDIDHNPILKQLKLLPKQYFIVSIHREENVENTQRLRELFASLNYLSKQYHLPIVVSLHPRTRIKRDFLNKLDPLVKLHNPFGFFAYTKLEKEAFCTLSDSGTIQEESAILGFPAIQLRVSTERPEAFDAGSIILTGFNQETLKKAIDLVTFEYAHSQTRTIPKDYLDPNVAVKVVKLILGLTSIRKYRHQE